MAPVHALDITVPSNRYLLASAEWNVIHSGTFGTVTSVCHLSTTDEQINANPARWITSEQNTFDTRFIGALTRRIPVEAGARQIRLSCIGTGAGPSVAQIFSSTLTALFLPEM